MLGSRWLESLSRSWFPHLRARFDPPLEDRLDLIKEFQLGNRRDLALCGTVTLWAPSKGIADMEASAARSARRISSQIEKLYMETKEKIQIAGIWAAKDMLAGADGVFSKQALDVDAIVTSLQREIDAIMRRNDRSQEDLRVWLDDPVYVPQATGPDLIRLKADYLDAWGKYEKFSKWLEGTIGK